MSLDVLFAHATNLIHTPADVAKLRQLILTLAVQDKLSTVKSTQIKLGAVIKLVSGQHLLSDEQNDTFQGMPYLTGPSDFGEIEPNVTRWTTFPKSVALPGDVLLSVKGSIGKTNKLQSEPMAIGRQIMAIRPQPDILGDYIFIVLRSAHSHFLSLSRGIAIPGISRSDVLNLTIPLPPLAEQRRIVAKVDALMARCDELEALLTERARQQERVAQAAVARVLAEPSVAALEMLFDPQIGVSPAALRQTILALAVQGKLVPQDASWQIVPLKQLTTKIGSGSTPQGGKEIYQDTGIPLIRSMNVYTGKFIYTGLAYINDEQAEKLRSVTVHVNDVLLNITGASIGRVTVVPENLVGARVNQHVCIIRPINELLPKYLEIVLASPQFQFIIFDVQVGATREALTKSMIESFEIPLPPLAEQRRIVAKVDALMALVDQLEAQQAQAQRTASALLDAVVAGEG
jgi:type I restriction enzyme S subunit